MINHYNIIIVYKKYKNFLLKVTFVVCDIFLWKESLLERVGELKHSDSAVRVSANQSRAIQVIVVEPVVETHHRIVHSDQVILALEFTAANVVNENVTVSRRENELLQIGFEIGRLVLGNVKTEEKE